MVFSREHGESCYNLKKKDKKNPAEMKEQMNQIQGKMSYEIVSNVMISHTGK